MASTGEFNPIPLTPNLNCALENCFSSGISKQRNLKSHFPSTCQAAPVDQASAGEPPPPTITSPATGVAASLTSRIAPAFVAALGKAATEIAPDAPPGLTLL